MTFHRRCGGFVELTQAELDDREAQVEAMPPERQGIRVWVNPRVAIITKQMEKPYE